MSDSIARTIPSYYRTVAKFTGEEFYPDLYSYCESALSTPEYLGCTDNWDYENLVSRRHGRLLLDAMLMGVFLFLASTFCVFSWARK